MFGNYITLPHLLIFIPLLTGLVTFFLKKETTARSWSLLSAIITLGVSVLSLVYANNRELSGTTFSYEWLKYIGSSFAVGLDGMGRLLTFLTAIAFPLIFVSTYKSSYKNSNAFYGLMLLSQAGLMGVFMSMDALLFYFFWELALIPVYFLCSRWGGERRIQATFKFFIYTFAGSLLMLLGIIYTYLHTAPTQFAEHSFSMSAFYSVVLNAHQQNWLFWLFFIAFAIKMPIFPFHTWQPDTYEQSPTAVTMVLSGIMVKMGLFAVLRWLLPVFPQAVLKFDNVVIGLSVIGIIYASLIAIKQDDLKRLAAYSSIAHIGLMCAAIFTTKSIGIEGVMIQMFNHGINIIGLWIVIELIERQTGVRKISQLSGVAHKAPVLTIMLVVIAFANIALPLTNAFVGEFMMFNGLFKFNIWYTAFAGISIILAAVYTLNMIKKVFYGDVNTVTTLMKEISWNEKLVLSVIVVAVFIVGVFPQPMLDLTKDTVTAIMIRFK
ncbi:NADH-quinone oxidoreductase subunit M [Ferruginibacter lapsinanis]|uniref:complex I subunit 4 family protein n=1 Tax=Ferruginibacter lapsinanis TaxID=563172 RepID=UPI001E61901F|nr:NADH-quinone oxidoreductase subunit M [Ferruginibacter lapsinanis]UEG50006.1 NADH-quinone oxidoreductase subunit M [Ferruginibacter lapsinanis]